MFQREWIDVNAAWMRWHAFEIEAHFDPKERPFFTFFDRVRAERLAANLYPGMASNLSNAEHLAPLSDLMRPIYLCARYLVDGNIDKARMFTQDWIRKNEKGFFYSHLITFREIFGSRSDKVSGDQRKSAAVATILHELLVSEAWQEAVLEDPFSFAEKIKPLVELCSEILVWSVAEPNLEANLIEDRSSPSLDFEPNETAPDAELAFGGASQSDAPIIRSYADYAVYCHSMDEIAPASHWYQSTDRQYLAELRDMDRRRARQLAHRLQRRLQVARRRTWQFDQEEGIIDSRRIARLIQAKSDRRVFRSESESPVPEACVSLLVDLSGSMGKERRLSAALAIDLAVHVLEICGIQCEVLGYTTRYGPENPIEESWKRSGQSARPGRLNAVRHIIFKTARHSWRRCRPCLGLLLRDGFGQENIDGEALHWAAQRLASVDVSRRILIVLSDGAPFDQATAAANGREFLCDHLRAVIGRLDAFPLHLLALGAGSDVKRFYRKSVVLEKPESVYETLFDNLGELLSSSKDNRDS